jgi:hypothetical protein
VPKLKPSPKSALPPRNPNAIWLPRLKAVNFASNAVIKRLKDAGLVLEEFDGIPDELALACIHNHIREIVSCYISDRAGALRNDVASAKIRKMVAKLERNVGDIIRQLPDESESALSADDRVIMEAIDRELDAIDCDEAPDLASIRVVLQALQNAAKRIRNDESGAGRPADRIAHNLVLGLRKIFEERTNKIATASPNGQFARFVIAVNKHIPKGYKLPLNELDHLIGTATAANITT